MFLVNDLEPGLALMDEIGRTALTNAFINFIRNTCDPSAYRDSLIYDGCRVTNVDETSTSAAVAAGEFDPGSASGPAKCKCNVVIGGVDTFAIIANLPISTGSH